MISKTFWLPFKTPTINHLYWHRGNVRIMYDKARKLREQIIKLIEPCPELYNKKLAVEIEVWENWYTLKREVKRKDIANREKFLIDSVFKGLQLDDKFIFIHTMKKIQSKDIEGARVKIWEI